MGMLFNTKGTVRITKKLTEAFSEGNFATLQANGVGGVSKDSLVTMLLDYPNTSTFSVAQAFGVHMDPGNDGVVSRNWGTWLGLLDAAGYQTDSNNNKQRTAVWVRSAMAAAINDPNCVGIEFFAIPGPTLQALLPFTKLGDPMGPPKYTRVITVQTRTVDGYYPGITVRKPKKFKKPRKRQKSGR
jgi:hypothetical protein